MAEQQIYNNKSINYVPSKQQRPKATYKWNVDMDMVGEDGDFDSEGNFVMASKKHSLWLIRGRVERFTEVEMKLKMQKNELTGCEIKREKDLYFIKIEHFEEFADHFNDALVDKLYEKMNERCKEETVQAGDINRASEAVKVGKQTENVQNRMPVEKTKTPIKSIYHDLDKQFEDEGHFNRVTEVVSRDNTNKKNLPLESKNKPMNGSLNARIDKQTKENVVSKSVDGKNSHINNRNTEFKPNSKSDSNSKSEKSEKSDEVYKIIESMKSILIPEDKLPRSNKSKAPVKDGSSIFDSEEPITVDKNIIKKKNAQVLNSKISAHSNNPDYIPKFSKPESPVNIKNAGIIKPVSERKVASEVRTENNVLTGKNASEDHKVLQGCVNSKDFLAENGCNIELPKLVKELRMMTKVEGITYIEKLSGMKEIDAKCFLELLIKESRIKICKNIDLDGFEKVERKVRKNKM